MSDAFFEHDGLRFRYREVGEGLPFVGQHGLGGDLTAIFDLIPPVPGIRMLGLDARGHGETQPLGPLEKLSIPQTVEDLTAWLDHLGIDRLIVGGISMGAAIALRFALLYPDRVVGLILSRPAWLDETYPDNLDIFPTMAACVRRYGPVEGRQRFLQTPEYQSLLAECPDAEAIFQNQFGHPRLADSFEKYERIPASRPWHNREDWASIKVPTLVISNRMDPIHPLAMAEESHRRIPGSKLVDVTPKSVSVERHNAEVVAAIRSFLEERLAEGRN
jgi:pimeloyl-ACP methyl ester carboxylesterase